MLRYCLLLILIIFPRAALAVPVVDVHLVYVDGDGAYFPNLKTLAVKVGEVGVSMRIRRVSYMESDPTDGGSANGRNLTLLVNHVGFQYWNKHARRYRWFRGVDVVHVVLPPFNEYGSGLSYMGGLGELCGRFSVSRVTSILPGRSECFIAHEISHTIGAGHANDSGNIMNGSLSGFVPRDAVTCPLGYEPQAVKQVRKCLGKRWMGRRHRNL